MDSEDGGTREISDDPELNIAERSIELSQSCFSIIIEILEGKNEQDDASTSFYKR
jgi:hypothetical protein